MSQDSIAHYFEQDHARLDRLFGTFRASKQADPAAAEQAYREFAVGLTRHIAWEEHVLFPVFEAKTGLQQTGPGVVMRMEHQHIIRLLEAILTQVEHGDAVGNADEAALSELLHAHNQKEEQILYPLIDQHLDDEERREVLAKMAHVAEGITQGGGTDAG